MLCIDTVPELYIPNASETLRCLLTYDPLTSFSLNTYQLVEVTNVMSIRISTSSLLTLRTRVLVSGDRVR